MPKRALKIYERVQAWPWRTIMKIAGVIAVVVIAGLIFHRIFIAPGQLREQVGEAKQDVRAAEATVNTVQAGQEMIEIREADYGARQIIVRENTREIVSAPGASDRVAPAVHDAFVNSIGRLREQADSGQRAPDQLP